MAAMMALGMSSAVYAADDTPTDDSTPTTKTKDVETSKGTDTQEGTVWGEISADTLHQLKVTMPIKIDFIISPTEGTAGSDPNVMTVGDYKIVVPKDSEVGVKLDSVKLTQALDSDWKLVTDASTETKDIHVVDMTIAGSKMENGKAIAPSTTDYKDGFIVDVNKSASLGIKGNGSAVEIKEAEASKLAFDVVYTISQYTAPEETPAP